MTKSLNDVRLIGHLGKDPEMRTTTKGKLVAYVDLATDESYTNRDTKQVVPHTEWHRVVAFDGLAKLIGERLIRGSHVYFEGKLRTRKWNNNGVDVYATEIMVNEMIMLETMTSDKPAAAHHVASNGNGGNGANMGNGNMAGAKSQGSQYGQRQAPNNSQPNFDDLDADFDRSAG